MDGNNNPELNMYDVECDNINNMLLKKEELVKERVPVNIMNDNKYKRCLFSFMISCICVLVCAFLTQPA